MALIEDGTGNGYVARITKDNRMLVRGVSQSAESFSNTVNGTAFHILVETTPSGPDQNFFYLKNTSTLDNIVIEGFEFRCSASETVSVYLNKVGTPVDGTTITPTNANTNSAKSLSSTTQEGANITGLTDGKLFDKIFFTGSSSQSFNFEVDLVVGPGGTVVFEAATGLNQINLTIPCYEEVQY